ncbi:hypothetical protein [Winogradskyella sp. UBA3174]|uniref:hypothetical protein n=1 Tax=Winogradskyella sp. UBA3174 TaxID=1947785 RepID=UPI0025D2597A|nr:hypothetical protein [Winogradskyella sp. UBA3174]|tara:strand:- start:111213 stop:112790 length:1578 start_codon:yes stop_codon:yes gene_type:complete
MNKYSFIKQLLENEKFNSNQKDRFLKLVSKELEDSDVRDNELIKDVEAIKKELGLSEEGNTNGLPDDSYLFDDWDFGNDEDKEEEDDGLVNDKEQNDKPELNESRVAIEILMESAVKNVDNSEKSSIRESVVEVDSDKSFGLKELEKASVKNAVIVGTEKDALEILEDEFISSDFNKKNLETSLDLKEDNSNYDELPNYYYPKSLYTFLLRYNQNKILKSTCHDIDSDELGIIKEYCNTEDYNFSKHLEKIIETYEIHEKKYFAPASLQTLFRVYLTGKNYKGELSKGWTSDVIKINWSCLDLKKWSDKNPNVPPNPSVGIVEERENTGYEFDSIESRITGQNLQSFSELVIHFKHLFHIRSDNSLKSLIYRKNEVEQWQNRIDFIIEDNTFPNNIEHFTDIDKLIQAYKRIILLVLEVAEIYQLEKPRVKLSASVDNNNFQFSIHHINTIYQKSIVNTEERLGQSYSHLIRNQINGLCEMYLRADFGQNKFAQINLWNGKQRKNELIVDNDFKGVEHLFVFPKK